MTARIETTGAGAAPAPEEVAAIVAALQAPAPDRAPASAGRWRRAGRSYGDDAQR